MLEKAYMLPSALRRPIVHRTRLTMSIHEPAAFHKHNRQMQFFATVPVFLEVNAFHLPRRRKPQPKPKNLFAVHDDPLSRFKNRADLTTSIRRRARGLPITNHQEP